MIETLFNREWLIIPRYIAHGDALIPLDPEVAFTTPYGFCVPINHAGMVILDDMREITRDSDDSYGEAILIEHTGEIRYIKNGGDGTIQIPITSKRWVFHSGGHRGHSRDTSAAYDYLLKDCSDAVQAVERLNRTHVNGIFDPYYFKVSDLSQYLSKNGHTKHYPLLKTFKRPRAKANTNDSQNSITV